MAPKPCYLNMLPAFPMNDIIDRARPDSIHLSETLLANPGIVEIPDFYNLGFDEFCLAGSAANSIYAGRIWPQPASGNRVCDIVGVSAVKKMIRIAAWRVIAAMTNDSHRLMTMMDVKCDPMSLKDFAVNIVRAVALSLMACLPRPATFGIVVNVNIAPEFVFMMR